MLKELAPGSSRRAHRTRAIVVAGSLAGILAVGSALAGERVSAWRTETIPAAPAPNPGAPELPAPSARQLTLSERAAAEVIKVTNAFRRRNGLPEFKEDPVCTAAAFGHAEDMVRRGYFSHFGPGGSTPTTRYQRHNADRQKVIRVTENLGRGNGTTPEGALRMWLNSPGHRKHLVGAEMDHIGVGVAQGTCFFAACTYYVQCFSNWP